MRPWALVRLLAVVFATTSIGFSFRYAAQHVRDDAEGWVFYAGLCAGSSFAVFFWCGCSAAAPLLSTSASHRPK